MVSSSPAVVVWVRSGRAAKSMTAAAGSRVSRPEVAGLMLASASGAAQQPAESFLAQDVADGGAAQRDSFLGEPGADLVDREALGRRSMTRPRAASFSPRERALVTLVAEGHTNAEVAAQLSLCVRTVAPAGYPLVVTTWPV